jgi:hypothetical protein
LRGFLPTGKADDAGGLPPGKEDNAVGRQKDRNYIVDFSGDEY